MHFTHDVHNVCFTIRKQDKSLRGCNMLTNVQQSRCPLVNGITLEIIFFHFPFFFFVFFMYYPTPTRMLRWQYHKTTYCHWEIFKVEWEEGSISPDSKLQLKMRNTQKNEGNHDIIQQRAQWSPDKREENRLQVNRLLGLSSIRLSNNVSVWLGRSGVCFAVLDADVKDPLDWIGSWKQLSVSEEWRPISCTTQNPGPTAPAKGPTADLRISSWFLSAVSGPVGTGLTKPVTEYDWKTSQRWLFVSFLLSKETMLSCTASLYFLKNINLFEFLTLDCLKNNKW